MSKSNDDFFNILQSLFGIHSGIGSEPNEDFDDYLSKLSLLGDVDRLSSLINRLHMLGIFSDKELDSILSQVDDISEQIRDSHDFSSFDDNCDSDDSNSSFSSNEEREEVLNKKRNKGTDKSFYIILMQELVHRSRSKEMKSVAFGPFKKNIAGWKMHLLENRVARYAKSKKGDMISFMKVRKGSSPDAYSWNLVCTDSRKSDRASILFKAMNERKSSFGFVMVREGDFRGADILDASALKDWGLCVDKKIKSTWNIDLISKIISGFTYEQK